MKIYIVVRQTEDSEFNSICSFYSVHSSMEKANKAIKQYVLDFNLGPGGFDEFEVLEREVD